MQDLALPRGASRLGYQSIDPGGRRLYIAHLGDGTVEAVDLAGPAVAGTVTGTASAHGVMVAPDRHTLLAAASGTNEVALIDTATLKETVRSPATPRTASPTIPTGQRPTSPTSTTTP